MLTPEDANGTRKMDAWGKNMRRGQGEIDQVAQAEQELIK